MFEKVANINIDLNIKNKNLKKENDKVKSEAIIGEVKYRLEEYVKEIKKKFKKENSSLIFSPSINDLKNLEEKLKEEIASTSSATEKELVNSLVVFHGDQKKKEREENLNKLDTKGPKIFLSTPSLFPFLLKDIFNLNLIIIDKENSFNYFSHSAKKEIDSREMIKNLSKSAQIK